MAVGPAGGEAEDVALASATDNCGRVKGYSTPYVTDGSLVPDTIGVNPFATATVTATVTALAERTMARVLVEDTAP